MYTRREFHCVTLGTYLIVLAALTLAGCGSNSTGPTVSIPFDANNFVAGVTNQLFPLAPGTINYYEGVSDGFAETDSVEVLSETKSILRIDATIVHDRVYTAGVLSEDTFDWYAQDQDGNVWYLGEDTKSLNSSGQVVSTEGSWEAGVNGAEAGLIMWADPAAHIGEEYRQEFARGVAEDLGKVVAVDQSVDVPFGSMTGCVKTEDRSVLESAVLENKFYCPGIGIALEQTIRGGDDVNRLVNVIMQ
jgi:hypothetical protein